MSDWVAPESGWYQWGNPPRRLSDEEVAVMGKGEPPAPGWYRWVDAPRESAFTCPRCGMVSHNPNDLREGYCGACHDWTGRRLTP